MRGFYMDFICIDFETANEKRASVCAIALIYFKNNEIVETKEWLIKPPLGYDYFNPFNIQIHGITPNDVVNSPEFIDVWPEIEPLINNRFLVAHNASFDISVLRSILDIYDISYPTFDFICTYKVSTKTWPNQINYTLKTIGNMLGYTFNHHDPHDDAKTAGKILIEACRENNVSDIYELAEKLNIRLGYIEPGNYRCCSTSNCYKALENHKAVNVKELIATTSDFDPEHSFYQKKVVFTGTLGSMTRQHAMQLVINAGGTPSNGVTKDTDFLIMGIQDYSKFADGKESNKTKQAKQFINEGWFIQIIDEDEFVRMV